MWHQFEFKLNNNIDSSLSSSVSQRSIVQTTRHSPLGGIDSWARD